MSSKRQIFFLAHFISLQKGIMCINGEKSIMQRKKENVQVEGKKAKACSFFGWQSLQKGNYTCMQSFTVHVEIFLVLVEVFMLATS